jgi:hypothetical protein
MKKLLFASILGLSSLGFVACSSDDDSTPVNADPMVGEWKAVELSYTIPNGPTHTFPFSAITNGCDVDDIELRANNSADVEVENKVNDVCTEQHYTGTWNNEVVNVEGLNPKQVVSVDANQLVLKYWMTYGTYGDIEVTVKYNRD